jgi:hypothetical protein
VSGDLDLEQRYRRVLRLLPGYYRDKWEEDMVAAFLDSWLTGDSDEDDAVLEFGKPEGGGSRAHWRGDPSQRATAAGLANPGRQGVVPGGRAG